MIRYRKPNRTRDLLGAILFAVAAAMLWVESSMAKNTADMVSVDSGSTANAAVIRSADQGTRGSL